MNYTYLMKSESTGLYKIGQAQDVQQRLKTLQTADPSIQLVASIESPMGYALERHLHTKYRQRRVWKDREWFRLDDWQVRDIVGGEWRGWREDTAFDIRRWWLWRLIRGLARGLLGGALELVGLAIIGLMLYAHDKPRVLRGLGIPQLASIQSAMIGILILIIVWITFSRIRKAR
jgi:predicted GIY-YIG superfamily endonuclease